MGDVVNVDFALDSVIGSASDALTAHIKLAATARGYDASHAPIVASVVLDAVESMQAYTFTMPVLNTPTQAALEDFANAIARQVLEHCLIEFGRAAVDLAYPVQNGRV